ncbi:MAG: hypothetical protein ACSHXF_16725 [Aquaticitalea sp.]
MLKTLLTPILFSISFSVFSQIGIGTTSPDATLDIRSSSLTAPTNTDGLLIPKINTFPSPNPTAAQQSMLVYLTTTSLGNPPGFYYWNNPTTTWMPFNASSASYWDRNAGGYLFPLNTSDRVEVFSNTDASGAAGSGGLEIANTLRIDGNEVITNTDTELLLQFGNNGDFSVDNNSLYVDSSANNVGIGTLAPDARLEIYNTTGTSRNLHLEKTTGTADAMLVENDGTGAGIRIENDNTNNTAELYNYGNGRGLYLYKATGTSEAARITNNGTGTGLYVYNNNTSNGSFLSNYGTGDALSIYKGAGNGEAVFVNNAANGSGLRVASSSSVANAINASSGGHYCNLGYAAQGGSWSIETGTAGIRGAANFIGVEGRANLSGSNVSDKMGGLFYVSNNLAQPSYSVPAVAAVGSIIDNTIYKILGFGIVSTIVKDTNDADRIMVAPESPEALFQDYGIGQLINGYVKIDLDPILSKNIAVDEHHPMKVFIQLEGECNGVYVTNKTATSFEVHELNGGSSNTTFSYQIIANRANENRDGVLSKYAEMRFKPFNRKFVNTEEKYPEETVMAQPETETKPARQERKEPANDRDQPVAKDMN